MNNLFFFVSKKILSKPLGELQYIIQKYFSNHNLIELPNAF